MVNIHRAKLDIKSVRPDFKPTFVQYDHARLEIKLTDGGQPYDISTATRVEFTHVRGDNVVIIQPGEIVNSNGNYIVAYEYQGSEMDVRGTVLTSFAIFDEAEKKVSSPTFEVTITKDLRNDIFSPAEPNTGLLQKLISDIEYIKENGVPGGGIGYTHPETHPSTMITTDATRRFTSDTEMDEKAALASPSLTGTPTAPTATTGANTTQLATTAFVKTAVDAHKTDIAPHQYGNRFEWHYNATTDSLDLVVLP